MNMFFRGLLIPVVALLAPVTVNAGDSSCEGFSSKNNPFVCGSYGNCTWWAAYKRSDLKSTMTRSAVYWYEDAQGKGFPVGAVPLENAVVVFTATADNAAGHVAYIEKVNSNGSFDVSEMDWFGSLGTGDGVQYATYSPVSGGYKRENGASVWVVKGFIYPLCNPTKWRCDLKVNGPIGWFPPVDYCEQASQWYNMALVNGEVIAVGSTTKAACPIACLAPLK